MLDVSDADLTAHTCPEASIQLHELIKDSDTTIQLQLFHRLSICQVPFFPRFGSLSISMVEMESLNNSCNRIEDPGRCE